jgi:hypothetical protein
MTNMIAIFVILVVYLIMVAAKSKVRRVILVHWKQRNESFEIFSNLKIFCARHPRYSYSTLSNYLSKNKMPYENEKVRVERKIVETSSIPRRTMALVVKRTLLKNHNEKAEDLKYWLSKTPQERIAAVTFLRSQILKPGQRMDKTFGRMTKMKR